MNTGTLDRLMLDDAMGALPADTSELLAAYAKTAGHEGELETWKRLAGRARDAMPEARVETLPAFPGSAMRRMRIVRNLGVGAAAAAMLLVGIEVGRILPGREGTRVVVQTQVVPRADAPAENAPVAEVGGDFWSTKRLLALRDRLDSGGLP